ncbi:MAG: OmpA family protein [Bacteroidota bacterium]
MPKSVILVSLILLGWIIGGTWWWTCKHRGLCAGQTSASVSAPDRTATDDTSSPNKTAITIPAKTSPFSIQYQGKPWFKGSDYIRFAKSQAAGFIPGSVRPGLDSLIAFLKSNPDTDLEITGMYAEAETNTSSSPNLGLGRAQFIQQMLIDNGISTDRLIQLPRQIAYDGYFSSDDTLYGGINLSLLDRVSGEIADAQARLAGDAANEGDGNATAPDGGSASSTTNDKAPTPSAVAFESRNFLFELAKSDLVLSADDRSYISGIIQYLRQNSGKKLLLTGHADNSGSTEKNMQYGWDRANTVKNFFTSFGLNAQQIVTDSKGDTAPVQPNGTAEGRRLNRRVEVRIAN